MFSLTFFYWSAIKREVLEIFNMNKKNVIAGFLFLNPPPIYQLFKFLAKWSRDISLDLLTQNAKDDDFSMCAKF